MTIHHPKCPKCDSSVNVTVCKDYAGIVSIGMASVLAFFALDVVKLRWWCSDCDFVFKAHSWDD